ncbi:rhomboid family GlyGly-CTERM serine protease [Acinetobacter marinus]|uniref:Rhomboid family GlyGly-CTERM serine protease n=1 Tax=Acinetobacter marinus TaxID=281375 RepID=A0A1G6LF65_9GAMM|nr:rhombosortase [Acinetobacter marinus]SDC41415.1 rhomboid family GlyGly-CTERM serine protease [Acinetobacter marinus]
MKREQGKLILITLSAALSAVLQFAPDLFIYFRELMPSQPWRFLTAHWVHVGWMHYLLNMIAFICFPFIFHHIRARVLLLMIVVVPILISLAFYYGFPQIEAYVGFSGVLHGLYAVAALLSLRFTRERWFAGLILLGLTAKLLWEATVGELSATMRMIGSPILIEAHQLGVLMSLLVLALILVWNKLCPKWALALFYTFQKPK